MAFKVIGKRADGGTNVYHGFETEIGAAAFGQLKVANGEIASYHVDVENTGTDDNHPKHPVQQ